MIPGAQQLFGIKTQMQFGKLWHGTPPGISDIVGAPKKEEQVEAALRELKSKV